jgi:hypothetical protein
MNTWQAGKHISKTEIRLQPGKTSRKIDIKIPNTSLEIVAFYEALAYIMSKGYWRISGYKNTPKYAAFNFSNGTNSYYSSSQEEIISWAKTL